ncbi:uncharacterized protein [Ptychodera flava]|uniref:uncharacterized protein n=1 Tax=Ptychodera flava TaxID=63121 RepID=UPI00396A0753
MGSPSLLQTLSIAVICILVLGTVVTEGFTEYTDENSLPFRLRIQLACQRETTRYSIPFICYMLENRDSDQRAVVKRQDPTAFSGVEKLRRTLLRQLLRRFCESGLSCNGDDVTLSPNNRNIADLAQDLIKAGLNPSEYRGSSKQ